MQLLYYPLLATALLFATVQLAAAMGFVGVMNAKGANPPRPATSFLIGIMLIAAAAVMAFAAGQHAKWVGWGTGELAIGVVAIQEGLRLKGWIGLSKVLFYALAALAILEGVLHLATH